MIIHCFSNFSPNPATDDCNAPCRITFCHVCYYADEHREVPEECDTCPYYPSVNQETEKCFRSWSTCVRRANAAKYVKVSINILRRGGVLGVLGHIVKVNELPAYAGSWKEGKTT